MASKKRGVRHSWEKLDDRELLKVRLCDLGLRIEESPLQSRVEQLYAELEQRGIQLRPHAWFSDDWFSPDAVPGIAVPFYLAHPRLIRLEKKMMLEVEGHTAASCLRILRHEAGHAVDTAFQLHRRKRWREIFGSFSEPYPQFYSPRPNSRNYVLHLDDWYAQAHPAEDFAETFAVWLRPGSRWRQMYAEWPALSKLEYVDELMHEIAGKKPKVTSRQSVDHLARQTETLGEHYSKKRAYYSEHIPTVFDRHLFKIFGDSPRYRNRETAVTFLRRYRGELRTLLAEWTGTSPYTVNQLLNEMIERSRALKLRLAHSDRETRQRLLIMLAVQTMRFILSGQLRMKM